MNAATIDAEQIAKLFSLEIIEETIRRKKLEFGTAKAGVQNDQ